MKQDMQIYQVFKEKPRKALKALNVAQVSRRDTDWKEPNLKVEEKKPRSTYKNKKNPKKITEYSKQDFNQKCGINSKARGNKPIPTPLSSPHPRPHSRQRAGLDMVPIYLILFLPQAQGNSVTSSDAQDPFLALGRKQIETVLSRFYPLSE